ncbi:MAG TPA: glutamate--tRNA ligase [Solibacterales bacterium]|nr:glutamate--tRNA ligase [Bryobacterales bacterium]
MLRVRFAPSPTGFLHIGSARTFIFNWLYARRNGGVMILRIDDTDIERNTDASLQSIFEGLAWLGLAWDEQYRQSDRLDLHRQAAATILEKGLAYRDFTPATHDEGERPRDAAQWLFNADMANLTPAESQRRADAGEKFVVRYRVPRDVTRDIEFLDGVYGHQSKSTADIEDFALLRSDGTPTYHLASCADDAALGITQVIRGQDHLSNTFKHILIFDALGGDVPSFAHLPLLVAPDGTKLSKRRHGPVVSVTTYRDAGFLPQAFVNFLCLLGWSPKNDREQLTLPELIELFSFDGINRSNAVVNFSELEPFDPKALWLNAQHLRSMPIEELLPFAEAELDRAGFSLPPGCDRQWLAATLDMLRARYQTLKDFGTRARPYFRDDFPMDDEALSRLDKPGAREGLRTLAERLAKLPEFTEAAVEAELRGLAAERGEKAGLLINAARSALTGQAVGPGAFHLFTAIGRERSIERLREV